MGSLTKLLAAGSPLIAAALGQIGIEVTETHVEAWLNLLLWLIALLTFFAPSVRAWINHREDAQ